VKVIGITAGLARRYALALFQIAQETRSFDTVQNSLARLEQAMAESADLRTLITSPLIAPGAAVKAIMATADDLGLDATVRNFLGLLARNRRLASLPAIIRAYRQMAADQRGETTAEVTSARELSAEQVERLRDTLKLKLRREVALDLRVDPAILGGLVVKVGSRLIDSSIRTKLAAVGAAMKGN